MNAQPYREPAYLALVDDPADLIPEPRIHCPECNTDMRLDVCQAGHVNSRRYGSLCSHARCNHHSMLQLRAPFCGPNKRRRSGFLWLRKCREPGTHMHQECAACGWRSISRERRPTSAQAKTVDCCEPNAAGDTTCLLPAKHDGQHMDARQNRW